MTAAGGYVARLGERTEAVGTVLCVGIDPVPDALPRGFGADVAGVARFARLIVEACAPIAAAFKPNLAYFEAFGSEGFAALESLRSAIPDGIPVTIDAKRGDIGTTAERQARSLIDVLGADAVTLSPYLGFDAIRPFLERGAFAYVLCRTSNPGAGEIQDVLVRRGEDPDAADEPLHERVARLVDGWAGDEGRLGLVVGATAPEELVAVRRAAPRLPFLVPGVGAQGGSLDSALRDGPASEGPAAAVTGGALLVNVSRGISEAARTDHGDPGEALAAAAREWASRLPARRVTPRPTPIA